MKSMHSFYNWFWSSVLHHQIVTSRAGTNFLYGAVKVMKSKQLFIFLKLGGGENKDKLLLGKLNILECAHWKIKERSQNCFFSPISFSSTSLQQWCSEWISFDPREHWPPVKQYGISQPVRGPRGRRGWPRLPASGSDTHICSMKRGQHTPEFLLLGCQQLPPCVFFQEKPRSSSSSRAAGPEAMCTNTTTRNKSCT